MLKTLDSGETLTIEQGYIQSVHPPETLFGFTVWGNMIPPERPDKMLVLGYGDGTVAGLTRKIWGDSFDVLGVDINGCSILSKDRLLVKDALQFVKDDEEVYDYIVVDLYNGGEICDFVFNREFIGGLARLCSKRVCINFFSLDQVNKFNYYCGDLFRFELLKHIGNNCILFLRKK